MRNIYSKLLVGLLLFFATVSVNAQITVTNPGNTTPGLAATYTDLASAVTALNAQTAISGPVTIAVDPGNPQTAPNGGYTITALLTGASSTNTVTFEGNANTITASAALTAGVLHDAIFEIIGSDYITIQNFTMQENAANTTTTAGSNNMTEFGVALFYASTTNGAQNITIQNNTIDLNRTYQNTFGIYSNSTHTATVVSTSASATTTAGANSGLKVYSNNITDVNQGIVVVGPTAAADMNTGIDIGGASGATANTITNFGTTGTFSTYANVSGTVYGILMRNSVGYNISYNSITSSVGGTTSGTLRGIYNVSASATPTGTYTNTINNNTIALTYGVATGTMQGITVEATNATTTSIQSINNNNFTTLTASIASSVAITAISAVAPHLTVSINNNTLTNITTNTTGSFTFIGHSFTMPAGGTTNINTNSVVTAFNKTGAGGTVTFSTTGASSPNGTTANYTSNNFSNVTVTGATGITGINNTDGSGSSPAKTITGNTFNNWTGGTSTLTGITVTYVGATTSSISSNTITNITGQSTITAINIGSTFNGATPLNVASNTITGLSSTGSGGSVTGISCSNTSLTVNINGNTINTLSSTGASSTVNGLAITGAATTNVFQNTINTLSGSGATSPVANGISVSGGTAVNVYKNKVYDISQSGVISTTSPAVNGILLSGGTTVSAYNNLVGDLRAPAANLTDAIRGISVTSATASTTFNVYYNSVYLNASSSGANFGTTGIFHAASATSTTATLNLRNNIIVNNSTPAGTGVVTCFRRSVAATLGNYGATSNNNDFYSTTGSVMHDGTTAFTIATFKTAVSPRDASSFSEDPEFQSTTGSSADFLKYRVDVAKQIESGGAGIGTPPFPVPYNDDYIGTIRQGSTGYAGTGTSPDIGAWELEGIGSDLSAPAISYTAIPNTSCTTDRTLSSTITDASGVNTTPGTKPRLYYKKSTDADTYAGNTSADNGWKYVEATNASSPFSFTTDYTLLTSPVVTGDSLSYFVVAQDNAGTPNVGINSGTFTLAPTSVALAAGQFPLTGTVNGYKIIAAGISGTVTIGAAQTYTSITGTGGLFDVINTGGISGNVTANIIDASVTETGAVALNAINYNGCAAGPYTVTIKPNTTATLTGSVASDALIKLNGADYVTIDGSNSGGSTKDLTITNSNTTAPSVISLISLGTGLGATNNTIKNCNINTGAATTIGYGISVGGATPGTSGADNDNTTIQNNTITIVPVGIYAIGTAATSTGGNDNLVISQNSIDFTTTVNSVFGMRVGNSLNSTVSNNTINIETSNALIAGISLETGFVSSTVNANLISKVKSTAPATIPVVRGIVIGTGQTGSALTISNNVIYNVIAAYATTNVGSNCAGIMLGATGVGTTYSIITGGINLYFNSVNLYGNVDRNAATTEYGMFVGSAVTSVDFRNNILSNSIVNVNASGTASKSYSIYSQSANTAYTTINYNDYYVSGTQGVLGFLTSDLLTLGDIQTGFGQNVNSLNADPQYNSATNLVPQTGSPVIAAGVTGTGVTTDITGFTRANPPTMGAYEQGADAAAPVITYTPLLVTCSTGDRALNGVTITDASGVPTSGSLQPRVYYKKGIGGTWFSSQGTLASGTGTNGTWNFTIVAADMGGLTTGDVVYYYVIAQDIAGTPNISANPGTGLVATDVNTVTTAPTTPNNYVIGATLSGSYNVGTGQTYTTLTAAITAYNTSCLGGAVTFLLTDANYTEAAAMTINANPDASATNTLTIKPTLSVTNISVTGGSTTAIFILNGADYVTIDGSIGSTANTVCPASVASRNLTITNSNAGTSSAVIWLQTAGSDAATNNTIKNANIVGSGNTQTLFAVGSGSSTISTTSLGTSNNNNSIVNNNISKTQYGIYSQGASIGTKNTGTVINQNLINTAAPDNVQFNGIWVGFDDGTTISGNNISNLTTTNDLSAIAVGISPVSISTTSSTGNEVTNALISNNVIGSVISTSATGYSAAGIIVASAASGTTRILNNVISGVTAPSTSGDLAAGIYALGGAAATQIHFNSVSMSGTRGSASYSSYALAIGGTTPVLDIKNNALFNSQTSTGAGQSYAIGLAYTSTTGSYLNLTSMKNDLDTSGTSALLAKVGSLSQGTGTTLATLAAWTTETGADATSISVDPMFNSTTNLRPQIGSPLVNAGIPAGGITEDILCVSRNITTPSIGAYELGADGLAPSITYTPLTSSCLTGDRLLNGVTIADVTGVPTAGALQPRVYFRKNAGTWFSSQGVLATGTGINGTWDFTISAATMGGLTGSDAIQYYVIAQDVAFPVNIGSSPSAGLVATDVNTVTVAPTTPNTDVVGTTMSGTYTVGTAGAFATLSAAITAYNNGCLAGPVVFELLDASYNTLVESAGETFPMSINLNATASTTNTLTIRPTLPSTVITGSSATSIITFNGARHVIIDGRIGSTGTTRDLTITNTTTTAPAVLFNNDANNDTVRYSILKSDNTATGVVNLLGTSGTAGNDMITIDNCNIGPNAGTPIFGIYSLGQSLTADNSSITVSNNNIFDFFSAGSASAGMNVNSFSSGWTITGNNFYQTATRTSTASNQHSGVFISNAGTGYTISNNNIGGSTTGAGGTAWTIAGAFTNRFVGISVSAASTATTSIQGNTIANFVTNTNSSAATANGNFSGIWVSGGNANIGTTTGNTIGSGTGTGSIAVTLQTNTGGAANMISYSGAGTADIRNNTIGSINLVGATTSIGQGINGIYVSGGTPTIIGNTIGSNGTANSINSLTAATVTQTVNGIQVTSGVTTGTSVAITGNTIANMNQSSTGTSAVIRGIIYSGTVLANISSNTIHDITGASANTTVAGGATAVQGICYTGTSPAGATISLNTVYAIRATNTGAVQTNPTGIGYSNPSGGVITRNTIYDITNASTMAVATTPPTAIGLLIRAALGTGVTISNNMISLGNGQTTNTEFIGMINSFNNVSNFVYYNTVNIEGTAASGALPSFCFLRGDNSAASAITSPVDIRNNIFNNTRTGGTGIHYAIGNNYGNAASSATGWAAGASNYNALNGSGGVGYWNTTQNFAGWKTASGGDGLSVSGVTVTFTNTATADLHLNMGVTPTQLESGGTVITGLTNDYDNDVRPGPAGSVNGGALAPDMGADEFDGVVLDLFVPTITYSVPTNSNCTSVQSFAANVTDNSGVNITAGTKPRIYYKRSTDGNVWNDNTNGTDGWKYAEATNAVNPFSFNIDYSLLNGGTGVIVGNTVEYFVVAQDLAGTPNVAINSGTFAATPASVALTGAAFPIGGTINSYNIVTGLNTTLTIGAAGDYTSLTGTSGLFNAINTNGLTGNTTVNILDASVTETGAIALKQIQSGGCSAGAFTLVIKPDAGVTTTLTGALDSRALIRVVSSGVTIDGSNNGSTSRNLTMTNTSVTGPTTLLIGSIGTTPVTNTTVKNSILINGINSATALAVADTTGSAGYFNNITIQNNSVQQSLYGCFINAAAVTGNGSGTLVTGNDMNTAGANSIRLVGIFAQGTDGITVSNNNIANIVNANAESPRGIWLGNGVSNATVSGNTISDLSLTNTGAFALTGIMLSGSTGTNMNISNNTISNLSNSGTTLSFAGILTFTPNTNITNNTVSGLTQVASAAYWGIVSSGSTSANISGNTISGLTTAGTGTSSGLNVQGVSTGVNIFGNKISNIKNTNTGGWGSNGLLLSSSSTTANIKAYNNVIWDIASYGFVGGGSADNGYGIIVTAGAGYDIDYNSVHMNTDQSVAGNPAAFNVTSAVTTAGAINLRNNVFANTQTATSGTDRFAIYSGAANTVFGTINNNDYYSTSGLIGFLGSNRATLANWQSATGQDANSLAVDPLFTTATNLNLLSTSTLIGAGVTVAGITKDYTNSTRNGTPSIGAYEDRVVFSTKIFLQGAYSGTSHRANTAQWTTATNAGALSHPYGAAPYSYTGTETVASGFFANTVSTTDPMDWVLLELRDATTPTTVISRRAAIIREDGQIVDLDGVSPVSFRGIDSGIHFVVIRHRNHLGVRTGTTQLIDGNAATPTTYDFTTGQSQALQDGAITTNAAMAQVSAGVFGLWAGNVNQDVYVRATTQTIPPPTKPSDVAAILTILGGNPNATGGYTPGDVNMDGYTRATTQTIPPPTKPSDGAVILSAPLGGNSNATRQEHKVNN